MSAELLDCRGQLCPLPVLHTRKALLALPSAARLVVWCTDPMAPLDIAALCAREGHRLHMTVEHPDGHVEVHVERAQA